MTWIHFPTIPHTPTLSLTTSPSMASLTPSSLNLSTTLHMHMHMHMQRTCLGWSTKRFPSLRSSRFRVCAAQAQPQTLQKVCDIVRKQLALPPESQLTPDTKFAALGADSLDTVEIVMGLEEEFGITVEEDGSQNISTVQEAADLIEKLVQEKSGAS
ncbi:hypothetical protein VNO78_10451 [Psophocarpus tetragonolobus]|uniref:Acyl carrier protein n=1 Tax=Psophocarpus tetragonolobus TaxID=3891 RepID=A0AAN9SKM1_PSOTE